MSQIVFRRVDGERGRFVYNNNLSISAFMQLQVKSWWWLRKMIVVFSSTSIGSRSNEKFVPNTCAENEFLWNWYDLLLNLICVPFTR